MKIFKYILILLLAGNLQAQLDSLINKTASQLSEITDDVTESNAAYWNSHAYQNIVDITKAITNRAYNVQDYSGFSGALTAATADSATLIVSSEIAITSATTVSGKTALVVNRNGRFNLTRKLTISVPFYAGPYQIFEGSLDSVTFSQGSVDFVYPEWWGAARDGSTDDSTEVHAAINSFSSGGTVQFLNGSYAFSGTINLKNKVNLRGQGIDTKLITADSTIDLLTGAGVSDIVISNIFFQGASPDNDDAVNTGKNCFNFTGGDSKRITIRDNHFEKFDDCVVADTSEQFSVKNNTATEIAGTLCHWRGMTDSEISGNRLDATRTVGNAQNAVNLVWLSATNDIFCSNITVANNQVKNTSFEGILVKGTRCTIVGNVVDAPGTGGGINLESNSGESSQPVTGGTYNTVVGNIVRNSTTTGIRVGDSANNVAGHHNVITGNVVDNSTTFGITLTDDASDNIVSSNWIYDTGGEGIRMAGAGCNDNILDGNFLQDCGDDTSESAIKIASGTANKITNNKINNSGGHGIHIDNGGGSPTPANYVISGNQIFDSGGNSSQSDTTRNGIHIDGGSQFLITNNLCRSSGTYQQFGIRITANGSKHIVGGNDCRDNDATGNGISILSPVDRAYNNHEDNNVMQAQASGSTISLVPEADIFTITGTTQIDSISTDDNWGQRRVTLKFEGSLVVNDTLNLKLNGDFSTSADDVLELVGDGTNWYEVGRSAN